MDRNQVNILQKICNKKRFTVSFEKRDTPFEYLKDFYDLTGHKTVSLKQSLQQSPTGIIAEFKRKSPTKGWFDPRANVEKVVKDYVASGATAVSILTESAHFGGWIHDFKKARREIDDIPFLRKDFIVDEYQVHQSKVMGADSILLIAACLTRQEVDQFTRIAHELSMEVLLEIHDESELDYLSDDIDVVGVNNRDLTTFQIDLDISRRLSTQIPPHMVRISESGISDVQTVRDLRKAGYQGFLMGENFMKTARPGQALADFIREI
jgi:indole-3-glycerol phosphate synthase